MRMTNRFPLVLDADVGNKIKELPSGDNLNLRESSIVNVQDITALGTINAADITVNGNRLVAQAFADLTDTPNSFVGAADYFVKVKEDGTGLEFRPFSDIGNIEVERIEVSEIILPTVDNTVDIGTDALGFRRVTATEFKGDLLTNNETKVFDAVTGFISYAALQGAPQFLSEFTDDIGFLRTEDLDDALGGLFDQGVPFATDIKGSVFADDSTAIVDGVAGVIRGDTEYVGTGFIRGQTVVILADGYVQLGQTEILTTIEPETNGEGSIGTESRRFGNGYFDTINVPTVQTESVQTGLGLGIGSISSSTDISLTAGNRVKIDGAVPFRFASVTTAEQLAIGAQEGDVIYNTTTSRLQMYQGSAWKDVNGNVEATTGTSNFNDVVVTGNLTVSGTTTTVNTTNTTISDNVIVLNSGESGAGVTNTTAGIEIDRGAVSNVSFVYNDSVDKWTLGSETLVAGTFEATTSVSTVGLTASIISNISGGGPLQIKSGVDGDTGNGILINPYGSDTYIQSQAETHFWGTGPYLDAGPNPYVQFKTAGAFEAKAGAYFVGNLTGDVVGSVFADDSAVMVDAVNNELTADKVNTQTVEGTSLILLSQSGVNITASTSALMRSLDGDFTIDATGGLAQLTGNGGNASVAVNGDTGQITIGSTHSVTLLGAAGAAVNIGTGTSGTVTLGNGTNTVDFASGSTADFTGATVTGLAANVTGNIDNTALTIGASAATSIAIGNAGSTTTINGTVNLPALIAGEITADNSISITTATGDGNAISIGPQGTNTFVNLTANNIRFFGPIVRNIEAQAGITGDLKGSVVADDSTVMIDGQSGTITGPVVSNSISGTLVKATTIENYTTDDLAINVDGFININAGTDDSGLSKIQMDQTGINYIELTTEPKTPGNPADVANIAINATASSGDVIIGTTGSTRSQAVTIHNATVNGTLEGNANGAHTGTLIGDVVGSIFADDSSVMVDAINFAMFSDMMTLTPLNTEPTDPVNGMMVIADGTGWDPAANGKNTLVVYLGGAWVTVAAAA